MADAIRDAEIDAIQATVYDAYGSEATGEPNVYTRRRSDGGLTDRENMVATVSNGTLNVTNLTLANDKYPPDFGNDGLFASEIVVSGGPYHWRKGMGTFGDFRQPRDFIADTYDDLRESQAHTDALKNGLRMRGFNVE